MHPESYLRGGSIATTLNVTALEGLWSKCRFYDEVSQGDRVAAKVVNGFQAEGIGLLSNISCRVAIHRSDLAEITGSHYPSNLFHRQVVQVHEPFEEEDTRIAANLGHRHSVFHGRANGLCR
jgi:hypothetical protein